MTARRRSASSSRIAELVHVSANLREDGGGAAHLGRVVGRALRRYASGHGLAFRGLHLPASDGHPALDGYTCFGGGRARMALAVAGLQARGARRRSLVFDHPGPARVQARVPAVLRARTAVFLLGIESWRPLERDRRRALASADLLLAISESTLERARAHLRRSSGEEVVYPGLEPVIAGGAVSRAALEAAGSGFALIVGRMSAAERYKGHDELIAAWPELVERVPGARLVVVGEGDDRPRLVAKAQSSGAFPSVVFLDGVDAATLSELYRRAALLALPSRGEGFGLVLLEAMAASLPCVALEGTAPAEIVRDRETGLLVPEGDRAALLDALATLFADRALGARLGRAGRERYEREFTFDAFERRFAPLLDRLTGVV
jgi:phosphatidylinositol alpha-1,6-mannosyltransferase